MRLVPSLLLAACLPAAGLAAEPPIVPSTREEMKTFLEGSKRHEPRLPLPELSDEDRKKAAGPRTGALGPIVNNGRMRQYYLPRELTSGGFFRGTDPNMSVDDTFKVMLFWIASRANNCAYCLGHQESKLAHAGVAEPTVAALDGNWSEFTPAQQAAFAYIAKLSTAPHELTDEDFAALRKHYSERQVLELLLASAGHNAMNRWTGALHIPQEDSRNYAATAADRDSDEPSLVAPLRSRPRPALESKPEVVAKLERARQRESRIATLTDAEACTALGIEDDGKPLPEWIKLMAHFPTAGKNRVQMHKAADTAGDLPALLRAQIAWAVARQDRAWYALGHAYKQLQNLGQTEDQIFALDGPEDSRPAGTTAALALAQKLTSMPHRVEDADIKALRDHFSDRQVAEIVFQITEGAFFDRVTEPAGLRLEP